MVTTEILPNLGVGLSQPFDSSDTPILALVSIYCSLPAKEVSMSNKIICLCRVEIVRFIHVTQKKSDGLNEGPTRESYSKNLNKLTKLTVKVWPQILMLTLPSTRTCLFLC